MSEANNTDSLSTETLKAYIKMMGKPLDLDNVVAISEVLSTIAMGNSKAAAQLTVLLIFTVVRQEIAHDIVKLLKLRASVTNEGNVNESVNKESESK